VVEEKKGLKIYFEVGGQILTRQKGGITLTKIIPKISTLDSN
jgi:hypothetical protein